jgi:hypothetical protein
VNDRVLATLEDGVDQCLQLPLPPGEQVASRNGGRRCEHLPDPNAKL